MLLNEKDRIILTACLPEQASLSEMGAIIELHGLLALSDEEKQSVEYTECNGSISWNANNLVEKDIPLKHEQVSVLKKAIDKADADGVVTAVQYETYLKIRNA